MLADAEHDLVPLLPARYQRGNELRWILEICVENDRRVSLSDIETRGDRGLVPEVPREPDDLAAGITVTEREQEFEGAIGAAVVDEDDLAWPVEAVDDSGEPCV